MSIRKLKVKVSTRNLFDDETFEKCENTQNTQENVKPSRCLKNANKNVDRNVSHISTVHKDVNKEVSGNDLYSVNVNADMDVDKDATNIECNSTVAVKNSENGHKKTVHEKVIPKECSSKTKFKTQKKTVHEKFNLNRGGMRNIELNASRFASVINSNLVKEPKSPLSVLIWIKIISLNWKILKGDSGTRTQMQMSIQISISVLMLNPG